VLHINTHQDRFQKNNSDTFLQQCESKVNSTRLNVKVKPHFFSKYDGELIPQVIIRSQHIENIKLMPEDIWHKKTRFYKIILSDMGTTSDFNSWIVTIIIEKLTTAHVVKLQLPRRISNIQPSKLPHK
jgi:hypothetical protein